MGNGKEWRLVLPEALMRLQDIDHIGYFSLILTVSQALQKNVSHKHILNYISTLLIQKHYSLRGSI